MLKWWTDLTRAQQLAFLPPLVTVAITIYLLQSGAYEKQFAIIALLIGSVVTLLIEKIQRSHFENDMSRDLKGAFVSFGLGNHDLKRLGGSGDAIDWLCQNSQGLEHVRNTVFCRVDQRRYSDVTSDHVKRFEETVRAALHSGCTWEDYFVPAERKTVEGLAQSLSKEDRDRYFATEIKCDLPLLQVITLTYRKTALADPRVETLFGWGFRGGDRGHCSVFRSTSKETKDYFDSYLNELGRGQTLVFSPQEPSTVMTVNPAKAPAGPS